MNTDNNYNDYEDFVCCYIKQGDFILIIGEHQLTYDSLFYSNLFYLQNV